MNLEEPEVSERDEEKKRDKQVGKAPSKSEMIKATITVELKELMAKSKGFQHQMQNAKTNTKKRYFRKKLAKNNQAAMKMLVALSQMNKPRNGMGGGM